MTVAVILLLGKDDEFPLYSSSQHHNRVPGGPLDDGKASNQQRQHNGHHRPPRPLDLSSSPPWFPAGPEHQTQWARHRRQRKNSVGYTFTDLAEIVVRNIKDGNDEDDDDVVASAHRYASTGLFIRSWER